MVTTFPPLAASSTKRRSGAPVPRYGIVWIHGRSKARLVGAGAPPRPRRALRCRPRERKVGVRVAGRERQRRVVVKARRVELAVLDECVPEVDSGDRIARMLDDRLGVERPRDVARPGTVQDRPQIGERAEMHRVAVEHLDIRPVGRRHAPEIFERDGVGPKRGSAACGIGRDARLQRVEQLVATRRIAGDPQRDRVSAPQIRIAQRPRRPCANSTV